MISCPCIMRMTGKRLNAKGWNGSEIHLDDGKKLRYSNTFKFKSDLVCCHNIICTSLFM